MNRKFLGIPSIVIVLSILTGCDKEELKPEKPKFNSFKMQLNGEEWMPVIPNNDSCKTAILASQGAFTGAGDPRTFYEITVTGKLDANGNPEQRLFIQVTDVKGVGTYELNRTYKEFYNYALFTSKKDGVTKTYVNRMDDHFFEIEINEFIEMNTPSYKGIKGTFNGVLYNELDENDSISISNGKFTLAYMNGVEPCDGGN